MSYGATKWAKPRTRARRASKRSASSTKTAKKSRRRSARPAPKKRAKRASAKRTTSKRARSSKPAKRKPARRAAKAKPPCKYGPRGADGYCPKKPKSARTVYRYDPETGRKVKVPADSPEAEAWLTRKPSKTMQGLISQAIQLGGTAGVSYVGTRVAKKAERKVATAVGRALQKGAGAGLGVVAQAAGVSSATAAAGIIAAALVGWNLGKAINYSVQHGEAAKLDKALQNYLAARREAAERLGRPLKPAELAKMYAAYKETVVRIKANDPQTYLRPGAE